MKVLVVEDDPRISDVLEYALKAEGHAVQKNAAGMAATTRVH
jgi:DNA-binding response OmpR family regulator